jgi:N-acetylglutamate synthase
MLPATPPSPTHSIQYRVMTAEDLPAARELWAVAEGVELDLGDSLPELEAYLQRNPELSQVAVEAGAMVGAVLAGHDGRRGYLYHLAVRADRQALGIGRQLVERSLQALKAAGMARALILVVSDNARGATFWQRRGWHPITTADAMYFNL